MDEESNALASAFLASELMDETRDYNDGWERAFRSWFSRRDDPREMNDYDAELRL